MSEELEQAQEQQESTPAVDLTKEVEELKTEIDNMKQKDNKNNEEWKELENKKLRILNNISKNMNIVDEEEDDTIAISTVKSENTQQRMLVDGNNKILNDYELFKRSLKLIDDFNENHPDDNVPIHPQFIDYMRDYVSHVDQGGNAMEYVNKNIFKTDLSRITNFPKKGAKSKCN